MRFSVFLLPIFFQGQFNFVEIVIKPFDNESNVITVNIKDELKDILTDTNRGPRVVSDKNLATLVRHIAVHVNVSTVSFTLAKNSLFSRHLPQLIFRERGGERDREGETDGRTDGWRGGKGEVGRERWGGRGGGGRGRWVESSVIYSLISCRYVFRCTTAHQ